MIIEDKRTRCPGCLKPLTWRSHVRKWTADGYVDEFTFQCVPCEHEYLFKENEFTELRKERDSFAEGLAIERIQLKEAAQVRLCPKCGGPLTHWTGSWGIWCKSCHQEYSLTDGELQPRTVGQPEPKPAVRDFYAIHEPR